MIIIIFVGGKGTPTNTGGVDPINVAIDQFIGENLISFSFKSVIWFSTTFNCIATQFS